MTLTEYNSKDTPPSGKRQNNTTRTYSRNNNDLQYLNSVYKFHHEMHIHIVGANDCSYWQMCWSALWIFDFLLRVSAPEPLKSMLKRVDTPFSSAFKRTTKRLVPFVNSRLIQTTVKKQYEVHSFHLK